MRTWESARQALVNLSSSKLRSFLAVLGILVGTASVVTLITGGLAATEKAMDQFKSLGTNIMEVHLNRNADPKEAMPDPMSVSLAFKIQDTIPEVMMVAPYANLYAPMTYEGHSYDGYVLGASEQLQTALKLNLAEGYFVSLLDTSERYCVIGAGLARDFKNQMMRSPLGQQIRLANQIYTIIGILGDWQQSGLFYTDLNRAVIVPIRGMQMIDPHAQISSLILQLTEKSDTDKVTNALKLYFQHHLPGMKVYIRSPKEFIEHMQSQQHTFTLLLGLIGSISLLVGGIGVMNVMLVSVTERKKEIGIRKAIGATQKNIQMLFLMESTVLALFGGTLGIVVGAVLSLVIAYFASWPMTLYVEPMIIGFLVSAFTGLFFGFYPAHRAAQLNPIEALRYD